MSKKEIFVSQKYRSPHFELKQIPVQFAVLHYTAQSLKASLRIFLSQSGKPLSCHLLIDEEGKIYELAECWKGLCRKAFHAGPSFFLDSKGRRWENFNSFSLGIELVNWNGNIFCFTDRQYESLCAALSHLKNVYPSLREPERILGHEHIAGFRGKKDPGCFFDWPRLFKGLYPELCRDSAPADEGLPRGGRRAPLLGAFARPSSFSERQSKFLAGFKNSKKWNDKSARRISLIMEKPWPFWLKQILFWIILR